MADMLVKLFRLKLEDAGIEKLLSQGIRIKKALAPDLSKVVDFAKNCSENDYSDEVRCAFANQPVTCYIAVKDRRLIGFACYEATAKDFFGPIVVAEEERGQGIGRALLVKSLLSMEEMGYAYGIIGWPADHAVGFYERTVGAVMIEESSHGVYKRMITIEE